MILAKNDIIKKIENENYEDCTPNGIDYRLKGVEVLNIDDEDFNCNNGIYHGEKHLPKYDVLLPDDDGLYFFEKGEYYIWDLGEHTIPDDCISLYFLRSTIMRCGGQLNSSVGDKGFHGHIKVGFIPHKDICIGLNERVVQAIYLQTTDSDELYDGDYQE